MVWGSDHGRGQRLFLLPHKKKTVQITNLSLVPKLKMIEATGPHVDRYNCTFTCISHVF